MNEPRPIKNHPPGEPDALPSNIVRIGPFLGQVLTDHAGRPLKVQSPVDFKESKPRSKAKK